MISVGRGTAVKNGTSLGRRLVYREDDDVALAEGMTFTTMVRVA